MGGQAAKIGPLRLELAVVVLAIGALFATPYLALMGVTSAIGFVGYTPTPEEFAAAERYLTAAFIVGTAVPIVGIAATVYTGQRGLRWLFGIVLAVTLTFGGMAWGDHVRDGWRQPQPVPDGPSVCQEHSGGDNRCPGG